MIDIQSTINAAMELEQGKEPNVKLALWAAALSPQQELEKNGALVELLRLRYVSNPLPEDREVLYQYLRQARGVLYSQHINALYAIEEAEKNGSLNGLEHIGTGYIEQALWRDKVLSLLQGKGMGLKTVSFAALLIDPLHCELCPIDRHVLIRLGYAVMSLRRKRYLEIEQEVIQERSNAGMAHIPLGIYHWYRWEEQRIAHSRAYHGDGGVQTHFKLSCRVY